LGLAQIGHKVTGVDRNRQRLEDLKSGIAPFHEPGLAEAIQQNQSARRLRFTGGVAEALAADQHIVMIAVQTPADERGGTDLTFVREAAHDIGRALRNEALVVIRSTVPVGTWRLLKEVLAREHGRPLKVASNPEFLSEGNALGAFLRPDRIVLGTEDADSEALLRRLYAPLGGHVIVTSPATAELAKLAANAFLATEISFINEMADLAEEVGADIREVSTILRLDGRIGPRAYLDAGAGYGGSCLPKDVWSLIHAGKSHGKALEIVEAASRVNQSRLRRILDKARELVGTLAGKNVTVWGLTFKPGTDDLRDAPGVKLVATLLAEGAHVRAHDPLVSNLQQPDCRGAELTLDMYEALVDSDLLIVATAWDAFRTASPGRIKQTMRDGNIVDGRNIFDPTTMRAAGLRYKGLGI
jgi:UDPglucose 6-dehydrogenase